MTTHNEKLERLDPRIMWPDEARDFTPWLAKNLHLLGEELGFGLELIQREKMVGNQFLDILAQRTDSKELVAIENQLEYTDTQHLGQLLAYATGTEAKIAIWIATGIRNEFAKALNALNEWTTDKIRFYGVMVELVKTNYGSRPEPRFRKVVYPSGLNWDLVLPTNSPPPHVQMYNDFFQPLVDKLIGMGFADKSVRLYDHTERYFPSQLHPGIWYQISFWGKKSAWTGLYIRSNENDFTKRIFDNLNKHRRVIESAIQAGPEPDWHWLRHDSHTFSSICVRIDGNINDSPARLEEIRAWMLDLLPKFKEVFDSQLATIFTRFQLDDES